MIREIVEQTGDAPIRALKLKWADDIAKAAAAHYGLRATPEVLMELRQLVEQGKERGL